MSGTESLGVCLDELILERETDDDPVYAPVVELRRLVRERVPDVEGVERYAEERYSVDPASGPPPAGAEIRAALARYVTGPTAPQVFLRSLHALAMADLHEWLCGPGVWPSDPESAQRLAERLEGHKLGFEGFEVDLAAEGDAPPVDYWTEREHLTTEGRLAALVRWRGERRVSRGVRPAAP